MNGTLNPTEVSQAAGELRSMARELTAAAERYGSVQGRVSATAEQLSPIADSPRMRRFDGQLRTVADHLADVPDALHQAGNTAQRLGDLASRVGGELAIIAKQLPELRMEVRALRFSSGDSAVTLRRIEEVEARILATERRREQLEEEWNTQARSAATFWTSITQLLASARNFDVMSGGRVDTGDLPTRTVGQRRESMALAAAEGAVQRARKLAANPDATMEDWDELARILDRHGSDPVFAWRFVERLGTEVLVRLPGAIEASWLGEEGNGELERRDPSDAWGVLLALSATLATASHTIGAPSGMPANFVDQLVGWTGLAGSLGPHDDARATLGEVGLLFSAGGFSDDALVALAAHAEHWLPQFAHHGTRQGRPDSPWRVFSEPAFTLMHAVAESPIAAASQPRLFAQLQLLGLDEDRLVRATLVAAERRAEDPEYAEALASEFVRLGLEEPQIEELTQFLEELAGYATFGSAFLSTVAAIDDMGWQVLDDLVSPDPQVRARAERLIDEKGFGPNAQLRMITGSRSFRIAARGLPAFGAATDFWRHMDKGRGLLEAGGRTAITAGGAVGLGFIAGFTASLFFPPAWVVFGAGLVGAGIGGIAGDVVGDVVFAENWDAVTWPQLDLIGELQQDLELLGTRTGADG